MKENGVFRSSSLQDTQQFASWLAPRLYFPSAILLEGALGSGKTTFSSALGHVLGVCGDINSPTFNLHHIYSFFRNNKEYHLHHIDLYRIKPEEDIRELFSFLYEEQDFLLILEWPSRLKSDFSLAGLSLVSIQIEILGTERFFHYQIE